MFGFNSFVCPEPQTTLSRDDPFQLYGLKQMRIIDTSNKYNENILRENLTIYGSWNTYSCSSHFNFQPII